VLARVGLVAKGVSYALVGVLAIGLALGAGGKATSRAGALRSLADEPFGKVVLTLLAGGFAAYALWRFVQAFAERADPSDGKEKGLAKKWGKQAGYVVRALIYSGLTYSTVRLLVGADEGRSQNREARQTTDTILSWPGGRLIVAAFGLVVLGVGASNVYRGLLRKFEKKWRTGQMSELEQTWGERIAVVGHVARGIVFGLIGVFFGKAAVEYEPKEAIGLDGALQKAAAAPYGPWLLALTAIGLMAYAVYCFVDARYRDVSAR
jgi:hypothetical protein